MKILFMGTPEFAKTALEAIYAGGHEVVGVVSQPAKKKGRGQKIVQTPVGEFAIEKNIELFQPDSVKNFELEEVLNRLEPEMIVVAAYGKILPEYILNYPKHGCINIHASLLPKYRGAAPIQRCIIDGEEKTGVTAMHMEKGLDTGDMIKKAELEILPDETAAELTVRLAELGGKLILDVISIAEKSALPREKQNDELSTYARMLEKKEGEIDWSKRGKEIKNLVRGLNSWPLAYTYYNGEIVKIGEASYEIESHSYKNGEVVLSDAKGGLKVAVSDGYIEIIQLQVEGKKMMSAKSYLMGHAIEKKTILGI